MKSIDGDIGRAERLQAQAEATDGSRKTASIVWLGYDAPQGIATDATETKWADNAREPLGNFIQGIEEANHVGSGVNQTLLGHSYGSLVVGETMSMHIDLPVDNAIMVGSPGVGVDHAKDLNISPDRVFAATSDHDLINLAPPTSRDPLASGVTPAGPAAAFEAPSADDPATRRALGHSSRIYDALQVGSAPTQPGGGLSTVRDASGTSVHHTWSTEPLPQDERAAAVERAQTFFQSAGWTVRRAPTVEGTPAVVAGHPRDRTVAQVAASTTGAVRVAVTTPATGPASADV
ncbi:alpha/beta hydrolase [Streptomyces sp. NBC_01233]|uniref:alpha/beta hydrolase n=1 Tax=Streptomyces sp. NBC_01233 TaxID=2903787 RepID=UPI002E1615BD|nr:alpha/beta hydrolase family protein [Streptomyces sp. NBC_01233]